MDEAMETLTMEEAYRQLDELLSEMEDGEHSLEETFTLYRKGVALVQCCNEKIDRIEKQLIVLEERGGAES
ncbi:MAG: exodeoxyribonuclease VII small subunit [Lachnospiraceae bacterium]|nr:exodeoxyribonuclease VII small subunit [Lachnospiraceae bacterium]MCD8125329.1 exodeoxyribonuclease VII small subunit [Lachnospiraceae bacterium]